MVNFSKLSTAVLAASLLSTSLAHPGEHHDVAHIKRELQAREILATRAANSLSKCAESAKFRALKKRAVARRSAAVERLRKARGLTTDGNRHDLHLLGTLVANRTL